MNKEYYLQILKKYKVSQNIINHSLGVYRVAEILSDKFIDKGYIINKEIILQAAILHDIDKEITKGEHQLHGLRSAEILRAEGIDNKVADIIKSHPADKIFSRGFEKISLEAKILYYSDKIFEQYLCSVEERILKWEEKHKLDKKLIVRMIAAVKNLERNLLNTINITFEDIKREFSKVSF